MRRYIGATLAALLLFVPSAPVRAHDPEATSILDKAIKALGGEEKLSKATAISWKSKGTIKLSGKDTELNTEVTIEGLDHHRTELGNAQFKRVVVLAGDKAWRKMGDNLTELHGGAIANEKRGIYFRVIPITLVPLKGDGFKYERAGDDKGGDKPAVLLKVTGPDGKEFTLHFDKESGLPVKQVVRGFGFQGRPETVEMTFADYKDFGGIKKATKVEIKRNGEKVEVVGITEFKILDKVDPATFAEPK